MISVIRLRSGSDDESVVCRADELEAMTLICKPRDESLCSQVTMNYGSISTCIFLFTPLFQGSIGISMMTSRIAAQTQPRAGYCVAQTFWKFTVFEKSEVVGYTGVEERLNWEYYQVLNAHKISIK